VSNCKTYDRRASGRRIAQDIEVIRAALKGVATASANNPSKPPGLFIIALPSLLPEEKIELTRGKNRIVFNVH
jgi:hypothetical protein